MKTKLLWTTQIILALLFVWAGGSKLVLPAAELAKQGHMPAAFLKFIALCEVLGGAGLVLPHIFRVREDLIPLAAAGLAIIMVGAVATTIAQGAGAAAMFPAVIGILCAMVARGRLRRPVAPAAA